MRFSLLPPFAGGLNTAVVVAESPKLDLTERLSRSQIFRDYERAFSEATGLPLAFQRTGRKKPALRESKFANEFCQQMTEIDEGCRMCVEVQEKIGQPDGEGTRSANCIAGLTDSAVPVRLGDQLLGFLQTGQVALKKPTRTAFRRIAKWLERRGAETDWEALEKAFLDSPVLSKTQYRAMLRLLEVFAQHLALAAEQIATQQANAEPPLVQRARQFIEEHQSEEIALGDVAHAVHTSTFHFCKTFKKATGFTFTQYVSLVRVARAKQRLANPQLRVSEIAYEVGFSSLTHFNRVFRKFAGMNPSDYRAQLAR